MSTESTGREPADVERPGRLDSSTDETRSRGEAIVSDVELVRTYRHAHNLAPDSFWTDERILSAIHFGME